MDKFTSTFNPPETVETNIMRAKDGNSLRYPLQSEYPAFIQYRIKEVIPASLTGTAAVVNKFKSTIPSKLNDADTVYGEQRLKDQDKAAQRAARETLYSKFNTVIEKANQDVQQRLKDAETQGNKPGILGFRTMYARKPSIKLYFPQAVQVHDNIQYDQANLGLAGAAGLAALNQGDSLMSAIGKGAQELGNSLFSLFELGNADAQTARLAAARAASLVSALTPASAQAALGLALQVKVNPNTRSIFTGVSVRNFQFVYDFYPTSADEANQVNSIIKQFRTTMYPLAIPENAVTNAGLPLGYKFPDLFEIRFKYGNQREIQMPKPLLCFLRDVSTTYNPGNMSFFEDGNATHIQMSLSFQEFRALNKQDIEKGH